MISSGAIGHQRVGMPGEEERRLALARHREPQGGKKARGAVPLSALASLRSTKVLVSSSSSAGTFEAQNRL